MTRTRRFAFVPTLSAAVVAARLAVIAAGLAVIAAGIAVPAGPALAQNSNFLDNLFNRGESQRGESPGQGQGQPPRMAQADDSDVSVRLDRMENALRQLTGTIEQLQYRNQQLEMQLRRMQDDTEYRFQQLGSKGANPAPAAPGGAPRPATPGQRGDVFDPSQQPNAPGAPRPLGNQASIIAAEPGTPIGAPIGAPGGRDAGAPLDLSTLAGNGAPATNLSMAQQQPQQQPQPPQQQWQQQQPQPSQQLPPPVRNTGAGGAQLATLPPSARPQDEYDMAYGYVLHKDYSLAEQAFRDFLRKHPTERLVPDAQYWLGESLFQQQRYRDAAESFLAVSTKFERTGKAPDALLRLGQSLAALDKKEAACATLAEVGRKYPKASASVKRSVTQEQKRVHC